MVKSGSGFSFGDKRINQGVLTDLTVHFSVMGFLINGYGPKVGLIIFEFDH